MKFFHTNLKKNVCVYALYIYNFITVNINSGDYPPISGLVCITNRPLSGVPRSEPWMDGWIREHSSVANLFVRLIRNAYFAPWVLVCTLV